MSNIVLHGWDFIMTPSRAILELAKSPRAYQVLNYLIFRARQKGAAWPGLKRIASDLQCSTGTITNAIKILTDQGYIYRYQHTPQSTATTYIFSSPDECQKFKIWLQKNPPPDIQGGESMPDLSCIAIPQNSEEPPTKKLGGGIVENCEQKNTQKNTQKKEESIQNDSHFVSEEPKKPNEHKKRFALLKRRFALPDKVIGSMAKKLTPLDELGYTCDDIGSMLDTLLRLCNQDTEKITPPAGYTFLTACINLLMAGYKPGEVESCVNHALSGLYWKNAMITPTSITKHIAAWSSSQKEKGNTKKRESSVPDLNSPAIKKARARQAKAALHTFLLSLKGDHYIKDGIDCVFEESDLLLYRENRIGINALIKKYEALPMQWIVDDPVDMKRQMRGISA